MKKEKIKFPDYAWIGGVGRCAMRLMKKAERQNVTLDIVVKGRPYYWRDGGAWGTAVKEKDGKLITCDHSGDFAYLNNKEVIPCTEEEWKKDNGEYAK